MTLCPHVRIFRLRHSQRFANKEKAMVHVRHLYRISTAEQEALVREHLGRILGEENEGWSCQRSRSE